MNSLVAASAQWAQVLSYGSICGGKKAGIMVGVALFNGGSKVTNGTCTVTRKTRQRKVSKAGGTSETMMIKSSRALFAIYKQPDMFTRSTKSLVQAARTADSVNNPRTSQIGVLA